MIVLAWLGNATFADEPNNVSTFRLAGYLPEYRFADFDDDAGQGLTDLIIFSAELADDGSLDARRLNRCPWPKLHRFRTKHHSRLILTIGGWNRSANFATVAASEQKRKHCVASIVRFAKANQLDGIDLDWEHPKNAAQEESYGKLLRELRTAFEPNGLILSVTVAAWQRLPQEAIRSVHYVQVMAYDHKEQHSTLANTARDLKTLLDAKILAKKIVLGLPFYGRDIRTRTAMTYADIVARYHPQSSSDQVEQIYFNGPDTIRQKTRLAIDSGLGGLMVWELGQDAPGRHSLLNVIRETMTSAAK